MVRAFIGIGLEPLAPAIEDVITRLQGVGADAKFVEPRNLHVNLKFLGDIADERTGPLSDVLSEVAGRNAPFTLHVHSTGVFPNPRRVRVVWLGLEPSPALGSLHEDVERAAEGLGFRRETRRYRPHITLARVRSGRNRTELVAAIEQLKTVDIGELPVEEFSLIQSALTPQGPIYSPLSTHRLEGRED